MSGFTIVAMPRLSDSMEEGIIVRWLKQDGDEVHRGDALVEIETDKATMTYEADARGILHSLVAEGETVALGEPIAELRTPRDDHSAVSPARQTIKPRARPPHDGSGSTQSERRYRAPTRRAPASPVARRLARELGLDLAALTGTGPGGRIVKRDVEAVSDTAAKKVGASQRRKPAVPRAASAAVHRSKGALTETALSQVQSTIAQRMSQSRATVPDFTIEIDVDADALVAVREQLREALGSSDPPPSYNDFILKATARALREFPRVNGAYRGGHIEEYSRVNVGVAVAVKGALLVPVVTDADRKSIGTIAHETRRLIGRAREGALTPPELGGATFTVSNLGMFGISRFAAIINQPQAAILAVGALERRAVVRGDQVVAAHVVTLTLCADHRILYGADAAAFLAGVRSYLQAPLQLLL